MEKNQSQMANLVSVFSSFQGEGPYIGYRQIFLRFANCNLNCAFCDTEFNSMPTSKIEQTPALQDFDLISNPIDIDTLFFYIKKLDTENKIHHSISLTGGEPLLQPDFLKLFLLENKTKYHYKIYLETNGTLPQNLEKIIPLIDIISMDIKIPSATKSSTEHWQEHKNFLDILSEQHKNKPDFFIKIVMNDDFSNYEFFNILWCISQVDNPKIILQPQSNCYLDGSKILIWQEKFLKHLSNIRIIPQSHKLVNNVL